jgi:imidazolonepropionase-like amidohydrolase
MLTRLSFSSPFIAAMPAAAETLVVHAGHLITDPMKPAAGPSTITIVDGRIQAIAPPASIAAPPGARLIDLSTRRCFPA